jgi:predicted GNAT family N-acyltransferase
MPALPFFRVELETGYSSGPERGQPWALSSPSMTHRPVGVERVEAQVVRPLRRDVLRPHQPEEMSLYPGDDDPRSAHAAVRRRVDSEVIAVGTVLPDPPPWDLRRHDGWRIRGMATRDEARGRGLGASVLAALLDHVAASGGGLVWCNARVPAQTLYTRAGFIARGQVFDIAGIGPHLHMWRTVSAEHHGHDRRLGDPGPAVST